MKFHNVIITSKVESLKYLTSSSYIETLVSVACQSMVTTSRTTFLLSCVHMTHMNKSHSHPMIKATHNRTSNRNHLGTIVVFLIAVIS